MKKHNYYLLIILISFFLVSCATKYNPDPSIASGLVQKIEIHKPFTITNSQKHLESRKLYLGNVIVNYHEFTESLVLALNKEIEAGIISQSNASNKHLQISVTNIESIASGINVKYIVSVEVTSEDKLIEYFDVNGTSDLDTAFKELVINILNNKNIINYLNG